MADVYRADDVVLRRAVAIKIFRGGVERDVHLARFRAEVRTLAALTHPHLVALYDAGGDVAEPWCAMEYVDGGSLADREGPVPLASVARIGEQIAAGLAYVHSQGIVHRDVKPSNVLLDSRGDAFLSDFGIAKLVDGTRMTQSGLMIGTAAFLSPEQVRGRTAGPPADVYALGLVLLEALTGRREYPGSPVESAVARLSRPPDVPADLGPEWGELIRGMTLEDADERPSPERVGITLRGIARRLAGLDSLDLVLDLTGTPDLAVVDHVARPAPSAAGAEGKRHGAVLFVPVAKATALPRPLPLPAPAGAPHVAKSPAGGSPDVPPAATSGARSGEASGPASGEAPDGAQGAGDGPGDTPPAAGVLVPVATALGEHTPVPVGAPRVPAPRNLLGWLSPERRRRAQLVLSGLGVVSIIAVGLPLLDGAARAGSSPLRIDGAAAPAGDAPKLTASAQIAGGAALPGDEQALRRAPVGVLIPPLPTDDRPPADTSDSTTRRWSRGKGLVAGTATTRQPSRSSSPSPRPTPSRSPSPSRTVSPSPTASPSPTPSASSSSPSSTETSTSTSTGSTTPETHTSTSAQSTSGTLSGTGSTSAGGSETAAVSDGATGTTFTTASVR